MEKKYALRTKAVDETQQISAAVHYDGIGRRLLTRKEAAIYLRSSTDTLDRLSRERKVAFYRIGRSVRFGPWDLTQLVSGRFVVVETIMGNLDRVMTKAEIAEFFSVSTRTVENLTRERRLWHQKMRGMVRFRLGDVLSQLENQFRFAPLQ